MDNISYSTAQAAKKLHISPATLQRWVREGKVTPFQKTKGGHARFTEEQIALLQEQLSQGALVGLPSTHDPRVDSLSAAVQKVNNFWTRNKILLIAIASCFFLSFVAGQVAELFYMGGAVEVVEQNPDGSFAVVESSDPKDDDVMARFSLLTGLTTLFQGLATVLIFVLIFKNIRRIPKDGIARFLEAHPRKFAGAFALLGASFLVNSLMGYAGIYETAWYPVLEQVANLMVFSGAALIVYSVWASLKTTLQSFTVAN